MKANKFVVTGLANPATILHVKHSICAHDGINAVRVDTQASTVTVDYDEAKYSEGDIKNLVGQTGVNVTKVM